MVDAAHVSSNGTFVSQDLDAPSVKEKNINISRVYSEAEALTIALDYFHGNELAAKVFLGKYAMRNEKGELVEASPIQLHMRLATEFARIDERYGEDFEKRLQVYLDALEGFSRVVPQGSPMAAIGNKYQRMSASNCMVIAPPEDSIEGIFRSGEELAQLMKRRAGVGLCLSTLRPDGLSVNNAARTTSGAWSFADFYSYVTRMIGQCIAKGERVLTRDGLSPIETIKAGQQVWTKEGWVKVNEVLENGSKEVVQLMTVNGHSLCATENHKVWTERNGQIEEVTIGELNEGDPIVMLPGKGSCGNKTMSHKFAYLTGVVNGCGYPVYDSMNALTGVKLPFLTRPVKEKVEAILRSHQMGIAEVEEEDQEEFTITLLPSAARDLMNGGLYGTVPMVPEKILNSTGGVQGAFLSGLFDTSGSVSETSIRFSNIDSLFRMDIQTLMMVNGVFGTNEQLHFVSVSDPYFKEKLSVLLEESEHMIKGPFSGDSANPPCAVTAVGLNPNQPCDIPMVKDEVQSICVIGDRETYDLSLEEEHLFWCEGFYVHNSGRRGALMLTMDVHHPDILKFITMKFNLSKVTGANISVKLSDEFLQALERDGEYELRWPLEGKPQVTEKIQAKEVWDLITTFATHTAEPGLIFWDAMKRDLPAHCYEEYKLSCVNPCAELNLSEFDSCRLTSLNLTGYVRNAFKDNAEFDWDKFSQDIHTGMQVMDNIVDIEIDLIEKIKEACSSKDEIELWTKFQESGRKGRRTGLGTHGLADTLAQLNIKYDSDKGLKLVDEIYETLRNESYGASVELAEKRGAFPVFDWEKEKDNAFIKRLPKTLQSRIQSSGRRNISILTQAPTGSVSIVSRCGEFNRFNVSSGVEPVFRNSYTRRKKLNPEDKGKADFVNDLGEAWEEFEIYHSNVQNYFEAKGEGELPSFFVTSDQIDGNKRIEIQGQEQQYVDHSISSCLAAGKNLISTSKGFLYPEEIVPESTGLKEFEDISGFKVLNSENKLVPATQGFKNGKARCLSIKVDGNRSLTSTPNHKVLVIKEGYDPQWVQADQIKIGDYIVGRLGTGLFADTSSVTFASVLGEFQTPISGGNTKKVTLPKRMNLSLARLLGYMVSDGAVGQNGISLCQQNNNVVSDFSQLVEEQFGLTSQIVPDERSDNLVNVVVNSRILRDFFKYLGVVPHNENNCIPKAIRLCAGREGVKEFLKGVTLDGFVSETKIGIATSISFRFLQECQSLLGELGVDANIVKGSEENERSFPSGKTYSCKESWILYCGKNESLKFATTIGFAEDRKNEEMISKFKQPMRKSLVGGCPDFGLREQFRKEILPKIKSDDLYKTFHSITSRKGMELTRESILKMADMGLAVPDRLIDGSWVFRKVTSIEEAGEFETFDISVPQGNSYTVNGLVSHNTINLPSDTTPEAVGDLYLAAWKKGLKGLTVYVDGSRDGVLVTDDKQKATSFKDKLEKLFPYLHKTLEQNPSLRIKEVLQPLLDAYHKGVEQDVKRDPTLEKVEVLIERHAPKRPKRLPSETHKIKVDFGNGEPTNAYVIVSFYSERPYEVFVIAPHQDLEEKDLQILELTTRTTSMLLRHQVPIRFICEQLDRTAGQYIFSIPTSISKILRQYDSPSFEPASIVRETVSHYNGNGSTTLAGLSKCPKCRERTYEMGEGCGKCVNCGYSSCN